MTTIVGDFRTKTMCADSRAEWGGRWWVCSDKLVRIGNDIFGFAGDTTDIQKMVEWFANGCDGKPPKVACGGLCMKVDGLYAVDSYGGLSRIEPGFFAVGSGGDAAIGAMMAGATALQAIEIASRIDTGTAGPFHTMTLKEPDESSPP